jgi:hypothetical protein
MTQWAEFIEQISTLSQIVCHQQIWNMQTNIYMNEEGTQKDPVDVLEALNNNMIGALSGPAKNFTFSGRLRRFLEKFEHSRKGQLGKRLVWMLCGRLRFKWDVICLHILVDFIFDGI